MTSYPLRVNQKHFFCSENCVGEDREGGCRKPLELGVGEGLFRLWRWWLVVMAPSLVVTGNETPTSFKQ